MYTISIVILFILTFIIRASYRYIGKKCIDYDTYYHLYLINFLRGHTLNNMIEEKKFLKPFSNYYPFFLHLILSFIPKKFDSYVEKYMNPLLDSLFAIILYIIFFHITNSYLLSISGICLYIFTPILFTLDKDGPRISSFTPRLFGEILGTLTFIAEYFYLETNQFAYFFLAILLAVCVHLTSKFSAQALVFINLTLGLLLLDIYILILPIISIMLAIILSKGIYWKILRQQISHLIWYSKAMKDNKINMSKRNNYSLLIKSLKNFNIHEVKDILKVWNSYSIVLLTYPIYYIALFLSIDAFYTNTYTTIDYFILSSFVVFSLTSSRMFLFLGVAERYLIHISFFVILKLLTLNYLPIILVFCFFLFLKYFYQDLCTLKHTVSNDKNSNLIKWIRTQNKDLKLATFPIHLGGWRLIYETNVQWLYWLSWEEKDKLEIEKYIRQFPYIELKKAYEIMNKYNLDCIAVDATQAKMIYGEKRFFDNKDILSIGHNTFIVFNKNTIRNEND